MNLTTMETGFKHPIRVVGEGEFRPKKMHASIFWLMNYYPKKYQH